MRVGRAGRGGGKCVGLGRRLPRQISEKGSAELGQGFLWAQRSA